MLGRAKLAESLNLDCINKSYSGPNKSYLATVTKHLDTFEKNDKIFIPWSTKIDTQ